MSDSSEVIQDENIISEDTNEVNSDQKTEKKKKQSKAHKVHKKKEAPGGGKDKKIRRSLLSRFDLLNRFRHWYMGGVSITRSMFRVRAAWQGVIIITSILAVLFILSAFYTGAGEFVISLDSTMSRDGFYLSDDNDFKDKKVCLRSNAVIADNISVFDISNNVTEVDGVNDGANYVAHTFYLTNETGKTKDYEYTLSIRNSSKNAEKALWVMVYKNGVQTTYAMIGKDGNPEKQQSIYEFPFSKDAAESTQYTVISGNESNLNTDEVYQAQSLNSVNQLTTIPFKSENEICSGIRKQFGK